MEKVNKILPFGLKIERLIPFFIFGKLLSLSAFAIFMMNR
tara:strand:+ start:494 stop:613 length:120 start_codon:yes stop_codon:yes gene_type:complete